MKTLTMLLSIANFVDPSSLSLIIQEIMSECSMLTFGFRFFKYLAFSLKKSPTTLETIQKSRLLMTDKFNDETFEKYKISILLYGIRLTILNMVRTILTYFNMRTQD